MGFLEFVNNKKFNVHKIEQKPSPLFTHMNIIPDSQNNLKYTSHQHKIMQKKRITFKDYFATKLTQDISLPDMPDVSSTPVSAGGFDCSAKDVADLKIIPDRRTVMKYKRPLIVGGKAIYQKKK